ncbi:tetratricopeptide repeat protein [Ekhidna sp.]
MKIVLLFIASFFSVIATSQTHSDSLLFQKNRSRKDTSQVLSLIALYEKLKYDEPEEAANHAWEALKLASNLNFKRGVVESQLVIGSFLDTRSNYDSALHVFEQALTLSERMKYRKGIMEALLGIGKTLRNVSKWDEAIPPLLRCIEMADLNMGDSIIVATSYNHLGNIYSDQNQFEKALDYYHKCLALLPDTDRAKAVVTLNIGLIHFRFGDLNKALEYYLECLKVAESLKEKLIIAHCYQKLGMVKRSLDEYDEAKRYYNLAIQQFELINDRSMVAYLHSNIANVYSDQEDYGQAIEQLLPSLQIQKEISDLVGQCYTLVNIGTNYMKIKEYQKAEQYLLLAQQLSSEVGVELISKDAAMRLSELFAEQRNFEKAFEYHVAFKILEDSIFNETRSNQIAEMEAKYETVQKEKEIDLLNAENQIAQLKIEKQSSLRNYLIGIACFMILLTLLIINRYRLQAKSNRELKELDKLKTNLFTNISHELRTPLTLIISPVNQLLKEARSAESQQELHLIKNNAKRLLELINQILDLSKLDAGKLSLTVSHGDINQSVRNTASSFESLANQKGIDFKIKTSSESIRMYFDHDKLQKIITNLLSNAFKFTPEGGAIQITSSVKSNSFELIIEDTGPGIPKEQQHRLFDRFYQLEQDDLNHLGTGVGLALTEELVELHHGKIIFNRTIDEKSEFTVSLPIQDKFYAKDKILNPEVVTNDSDTLHIPTENFNELNQPKEDLPIALVVEDNDDLRTHIRSLLQKEYEVHISKDGEEGIKKAFEVIPDIIVSDLMMPKTDGMELCEKIKTDERSNHIPIILLTAKADKKSKLEGLNIGADDYLTKPFDAEELTVRMNNLIEQRLKLRERFSSKITVQPSQISIDPPEELFIKKAIEIVEENISNVEFNVEAFQLEIGMSRMQLHRKLKATTNYSSSEFIRTLRLQRAAQLLSNEGINVAQAAYQSGFNSLSYFNQCFKEKFGVSPSKYTNK